MDGLSSCAGWFVDTKNMGNTDLNWRAASFRQAGDYIHFLVKDKACLNFSHLVYFGLRD